MGCSLSKQDADTVPKANQVPPLSDKSAGSDDAGRDGAVPDLAFGGVELQVRQEAESGGAMHRVVPPAFKFGRQLSADAREDDAVANSEVREILVQHADEVEETKTYMVALIAHDMMKPLMRKFIQVHIEQLKKFQLTGTGTTCNIMRSEGLEPVGQVASGPLGGDQQIGAMIVEGKVHAVLFFRDPLTSHAHSEDIGALGRLCDCYQCYFATNYRSASACLEAMHAHLLSRRSVIMPDGIADLANAVQSEYLATRAAAVAK